MDDQKTPEPSFSEKTTRELAYSLVILFTTVLTIIAIFSAYQLKSDNKWCELFGNGFMYVAGALTTVIGYYFGSKGTRDAQEKAIVATVEAHKAKIEASEEKAQKEEIIRELEEEKAPTKSETDDISVKTIPTIKESDSAYSIETKEVTGIEPKTFRQNGKPHHRVRISLSAKPEDLDEVKCVLYQLHPSFKNRFRESTDRRNNFEILIWTYGYFKIKATLMFKDNSEKTIEGAVEW